MTKGIFAAVAALVMTAAGAAEELKVEKLADDLFRVRMSRDGKWPESKLNRYGIIEKFDARETTSSPDLGVIKPEARQVGKGFELRFPLAKDERVYGLGDSSRECIQRRGGRYDIWVANFTCYIPIPMAMTSRGWGVLVNTTYRHVFDVGKTDPDAMVVTAEEGEVDFYVFTGRDYRALLEAYTRLTGRPALLPAYAYGYTYVANQWTDMFKFTQEAYKFRELGLPCDIMGLEPGWMEYFYDETTKKAWNQGRFNFPYWATPDKHSVTWVGALERMGFKLSLWLCMNYDLFVFEEACAEGRAKPSKEKIVKNASDKVGSWLDAHIAGKFDEVKEREFDPKQFRADLANARRDKVMRTDGMRGYDQSGEEPWFDHLKKFVDRGVRCFKMDASNQVGNHGDRVWAGKYVEAEMHNVYPVVYAKQMTEGYSTYTDSRAMAYSAGGYVGVQRYVATWAGDTGGGKKPFVSALNLGLTGHPNQSCDMEQFDMRGTHFGCFAPWTQHNNWDYFRQPWYCEKEDFEAFKYYISLRYRLFPYIYGAAAEASRTGWPFMRALVLEYPDVAEYADECGTYMFGDSMLVSTFSDTVKIPAGTWYEWRSGKAVTGPATLPVEVTRDWGGALYVKAGAIVPMWPQKQHLEKGWNDKVELHAYLGADGEATWYEDDGDSLKYREGAFATAKLALKGRTLTIGAMTGDFAGKPSAHDITVVWHDGGKTKAEKLGSVPSDRATSVTFGK